MKKFLELLLCVLIFTVSAGATTYTGGGSTSSYLGASLGAEVVGSDVIIVYSVPAQNSFGIGYGVVVTEMDGPGPGGSAIHVWFNDSPSSSDSGSMTITGGAGAWYRLYCIGPDASDPSTRDASYSQWHAVVETVKRVKISYLNNQDYGVNLKLVDHANPATTVTTFTLAAHAGMIEVVTLPSGVDAVDLLVEVPGIELVGTSWMLVEGAVTSRPTTSNVAGTPTPATPPTTTVPEPSGLPGASSSTTPGVTPPTAPRPPVWTTTTNTVDGDRLDKATYREGTNKLIEEMIGTPIVVSPLAAPKDSDAVWQPASTLNSVVISKLPAPPTINTSLTESHSISIHFTVPKLSGGEFVVEKSVDFSAAPYSGPIAVFRGLQLVLITIVFYLACFWAVRGAFASK